MVNNLISQFSYYILNLICTSLSELNEAYHVNFFIVLLQHGADHNIRNTDGKTALDLADTAAKSVLTGKGVT